MQIIVRGHQLKITPAIRAYAEKKLKRLERYFSNINTITVELEVKKIKEKSRSQIAHVTIDLSQGILRANEADSDIYAALDKVLDKLEPQVKKHHEKLKTRRHSVGPRLLWQRRSFLPAFLRKKQVLRPEDMRFVAKVANPIKPMDPPEAVLEFKLAKGELFMFKNPRDGSLNVLHTLADGGYGLYHTTPQVKLNWWQRLFSRKVDPAYGEKSIKYTVPLGKIIRASREEAAARMQQNDWRYYFFQDEETNRTNLIYELPKGGYGIVESHF